MYAHDLDALSKQYWPSIFCLRSCRRNVFYAKVSQTKNQLVDELRGRDGEDVTPPLGLHGLILTPPSTGEKQAQDTRDIHRQVA